jgi:hypothetical protein
VSSPKARIIRPGQTQPRSILDVMVVAANFAGPSGGTRMTMTDRRTTKAFPSAECVRQIHFLILATSTKFGFPMRDKKVT